MYRLLLALCVLVGAGVSFGAPEDEWYVDPECVELHLDVWIDYVVGNGRVDDGDPDGDPFTYVCETSEGEFVGTIEHVNAAVTFMGVPWSDRRLSATTNLAIENGTFFETEINANSNVYWPVSQVTSFRLSGPGATSGSTCQFQGRDLSGAGWHYVAAAGSCWAGIGSEAQRAEAVSLYELYIEPARNLATAIGVAADFVPESHFVSSLEVVFYGGVQDSENYPDGYEPPGGGGGGGPDWEDVPEDAESGCRILDLFCWAEWAFVPHVEWGAEFAAVQASVGTRVPFGYASWFTPWHASFADGEELTVDLSDVCFDGLGQDRICAPDLELHEVPGFAWWLEHGRTWLFRVFVVLFWWAAFRRFMG